MNSLRSNLLSHQLSLNTAFQMVQLYAQVNLPAPEEPDLRPQISRLISPVEKLPGARGNNNGHKDDGKPSSEDVQADPITLSFLRKAAI